MARRGEEHNWHEFQWFCQQIKDPEKCGLFQQMTGKCGDVVLMHPFMMHSASRNSLHVPRVITNPFVCLKEPFNFDRADPREYSLVEKKTLKELGVDSLPNWKIKGNREVLETRKRGYPCSDERDGAEKARWRGRWAGRGLGR